MTIDYEDIKKQVRIILDENEDVSPLLSATDGIEDYDALQTDKITESMILQAVDRVHRIAPIDMIMDAAEIAHVDWTLYNLVQRCKLPDDYLRLVSVRLMNWDVTVNEFCEDGSAEYLTMFGRFAAIRPTALRPKVGLSFIANSVYIVAAPVRTEKLKVSMNDSWKDDLIEKGLLTDTDNRWPSAEKPAIPENQLDMGVVWYIKKAEEGGKIARLCEQAVLYMIANLYYTTINESQRAIMMAQEVADLLGLKVNNNNIDQA